MSDPTLPNFVVVSPSSGITSGGPQPATIPIGLNEPVVRTLVPGTHILQVVFSTVDQSPPAQAVTQIVLSLAGPPRPSISSVVNTASFQPTLSPGAMFSIMGDHLASQFLPTFDTSGKYPTSFGKGTTLFSTMVLVSGIPAPLLYASPTQINAVVPYGVAGQSTASIVVTRYSSSTAPFVVPLLDTSPGIFTVAQNGNGQAAAMNVIANPGLAADPSNIVPNGYNGPGNPVRRQSEDPIAAIQLFVTGAGVWNPPVEDGAIALFRPFRYDFTDQPPIVVTIGGQGTHIYYVGPVPYQVWGCFKSSPSCPTASHRVRSQWL